MIVMVPVVVGMVVRHGKTLHYNITGVHALAGPRRRPPRRRGTQYAAASRFNHGRLWNTGSSAFADDDDRMRGCVLATLTARGFALILAPSKSEGAGKTGCTLHPRSRVPFALKKMHTSIQVQRRHPAFPAQWLYGLLRALPGERLFCHRRPQEAWLPRNLTPAPRRQNHTTSPYASCQPRQSWLPRPPHPTARFVTIANRPSCRVRQAITELICVRTKGEYFREGCWTNA